MELRILQQDSEDKRIADAINEESFPEYESNSLDDLYASDTSEKLDMLGMESFIEAFRYDGIPDEVFSRLCEMKDAPFSNTLGYRDSKGLDYKKYEQKFVYAMQKHIYAVIEIKSAVKEYLYHKKINLERWIISQ